jgi:hypothetical protein
MLSAEFNTTILDEYHEKLSQILVDSSNRVDDYFIESNTTKKNKTEAELKTSFAIESSRKSEYAMRLRLRISLPKIQKKLRLIFEDEDSDDILYDGTILDNQHKVEQKNYFLRLDYFNYIRKKLKLTSGIGIKFRKLNLYPYINIKARYVLDRSHVITSNRFRLYSDGEFEDIVTINRIKHFNSSTYIFYRNFFKYKSQTENSSIVNSISATKIVTDRREVSVGLSFTSELERVKSYLRYPQLYIAYRDLLYKKWVYYEIKNSILWREENDFDSSYRFMFNLGVKFKND